MYKQVGFWFPIRAFFGLDLSFEEENDASIPKALPRLEDCPSCSNQESTSTCQRANNQIKLASSIRLLLLLLLAMLLLSSSKLSSRGGVVVRALRSVTSVNSLQDLR
uniref:Uncharacterized protein n=1 Tax=Glossina pallidipes TaxID=7398 RepID=A0A1A9ZT38_GLOPL